MEYNHQHCYMALLLTEMRRDLRKFLNKLLFYKPSLFKCNGAAIKLSRSNFFGLFGLAAATALFETNGLNEAESFLRVLGA
jgi:hypothetical protein